MLVSLALGDLRRFSFRTVDGRVVFSMVYLILGASIVAFTAYVWLLGRMPATRVASHAYVNPVVAVALGYFVAGEELSTRTLLASTLVVLSVFLILRVGTATVKK